MITPFEVVCKDNHKLIRTVYDIRVDSFVNTLFLIYANNEWIWSPANCYIPLSERKRRNPFPT